MASSLKRLLGIRAMQEDIARTEFAAETARMRRLERLAGEAASEALNSRERWFAAVEHERAEAAGPDRLAEESAWELAVWRRARVEALQPAQRAEVARAEGEFLDGRRARMQVESLVESAKSLENRDEARAEQRRLDDWHQSRPKKQPTEAGSKRVVREEGNARRASF